METTERQHRPWAPGIGLFLLGLAVSASASVLGLQGEAAPASRALGTAGYVGGVVLAGAGIHRILWVGPTRRPRATRLLVTALVTIPAFVATALLLSLLLTVVQLRLRF